MAALMLCQGEQDFGALLRAHGGDYSRWYFWLLAEGWGQHDLPALVWSLIWPGGI